MAAMLLPAFLCLASSAHADQPQGQLDFAKLRSAVLQLIEDWSKTMLFASRDMSRDGWLDANVASSPFKDVQIEVMYFDYAYEDVPKTSEACRALAMRFGMNVGAYVDQIMATGIRPAEGVASP